MDLILDYLKNYFNYLENLQTLNIIHDFSSLMYTDFSVLNFIPKNCESLNASWPAIFTVFVIGFFTLSLITSFYKKKKLISTTSCKVCQAKTKKIVCFPGYVCLCYTDFII